MLTLRLLLSIMRRRRDFCFSFSSYLCENVCECTCMCVCVCGFENSAVSSNDWRDSEKMALLAGSRHDSSNVCLLVCIS